MRQIGIALPFMILLLFFSCSGEKPDPCTASPTYVNNILPLVEEKCIGCHSETLVSGARNGAPENLNWNSFELIEANKDEFTSAITTGRMPPSGSAEPATTKEERGMLEDWLLCGFKE